MINILKAIIIDDKKNEHLDLYNEIHSDKFFNEYAETKFDLIVSDGSDDIRDLLYENKGFDCIITIGDENKIYYKSLSYYNFQIRKKWSNILEFDAQVIAKTIINVFFGNINRSNPKENELFSFFTCSFNTDREVLNRLYNSMCSQTYKEWNWFILDDSTNLNVINFINEVRDYRITVIKNITDHGSIGFNKRTVAMMCDGDYLVEVDHDDELTSDCLFYLKKAFDTYPDSDFVYSNVLEDMDGTPCIYSEGWGWGEGQTKEEIIKGKKTEYSDTPEINPFTIRTIYAQPNHVRCWKKTFYHKIDGHNVNFGVLDDMELLIRTFLFGVMTKVEKVLYIQYEKPNRGEQTGTTQSKRFGEIQRTCWLLKGFYDEKIHERILELGFSDYAWDDEQHCSVLWRKHIPGLEIMSHLLTV